jgi:hypothetical protein
MSESNKCGPVALTLASGEINPVNAAVAGWVNVVTMEVNSEVSNRYFKNR